ncbi:MAG: hypothetical protein ACO3WM_06770, partial [Gemmobacter sp.]
MPTLTVLAPDSSLAMDEIARQLGDNAYILSTTKRDGMVEIKATNDPIPPSPRESKARSAFAAALAEHGATEEVMVLQRPREGHLDPAAREPALAEAAHAEAALAAPRPSATVVRLQQPGGAPQRAGRAPAVRPLAPARPLPEAAGPAPQPARTGTKRPPEGDEVIRTLGRLHEALSSLRETMLRTDITVPDFERLDSDPPAHAAQAAATPRTPDPAQRILAAGFDAAL